MRDCDDPAAKAARRRFTEQYKLAILAEYDALSDPGAKGARVRQERLYSSHIVEWRRACDVGALSGLAGMRRKKRSDAERELKKAKKQTEWIDQRTRSHGLRRFSAWQGHEQVRTRGTQ